MHCCALVPTMACRRIAATAKRRAGDARKPRHGAAVEKTGPATMFGLPPINSAKSGLLLQALSKECV